MEEKIVKGLEDPLNLINVLQQYHLTCKTSKKEVITNLSLRCFIQIYCKLEKPEWANQIDPKCLLEFSCSLSEQMNSLSESHEKKYLASMTNIHRFLMKKKLSPDDCGRLSDQIFKSSHVKISPTNNKVYWIILVDKLTSLEQVSNSNCSHLNDLISNILTIADSHGLATFVKDLLPWLLKKLSNMYNEKFPEELNLAYKKLFDQLNLSSKSEKVGDYLTLFKSCLTCLSSINQNIVSCEYATSETFSGAVVLFSKMFDKNSICHFYLNILSSLLETFVKANLNASPNRDRVILNIVKKLYQCYKENKFDNSADEFLCILRKILNSYLTFIVMFDESSWTEYVPISVQHSIIKLITVIMKLLAKSKIQVSICEGCSFKTGIHDGIYLIRFVRNFIALSTKCKLPISPLVDAVYECEKQKFSLLKLLFENNCPSWNTYWTKLQMETHNNAISLYNQRLYEDSLRHFKMYLAQFREVMSWNMNLCDLNNLSRSFYNMAICQLDMEHFKDALESCYIHLILRKYIQKEFDFNDFSLQIKSKVYNFTKEPINAKLAPSEIEAILKFSLVDAANSFLSDKDNLIFKSMFAQVDFSRLFFDEFTTYFKIWSSSQIAGYTCQAFLDLMKQKKLTKDTKDTIINAGKSVVLIGAHCNKLMNDSIVEFVQYTTSQLEKLLKICKSTEDILTTKILLANCLEIYYECNMIEMRKVVHVSAETSDGKNPSAPYNAPHPDDACDVTPTHQSLTVKKEHEVIEPLYKAAELWKEIALEPQQLIELLKNSEFGFLLEQSIDLIEKTCQFLILHHLDALAIILIDIGYTLSITINYKMGILKFTNIILEKAKTSDATLRPLIHIANTIVFGILTNVSKNVNDSDIALEYLLNLALYYIHVGHHEKASTLIMFVNCKLLESGVKMEDFKVSHPKLSIVSAVALQVFPNGRAGNCLTSHIQAHAECTEMMRVCNDRRNRQWLIVTRMLLDSAMMASRIAASFGFLRRVRALLKNPLTLTQRLLYPQRASHILAVLANVDLQAERFDDCRVKLDGLTFILDERCEKRLDDRILSAPISRSKSPVFRTKLLPNDLDDNAKPLESVMDVQIERRQGSSICSSPTFNPSPFSLPDFIDHKKSCTCIKCSSTFLFSINLDVVRLEGILRSRVESISDAESFFNGSWQLLKNLHSRKNYVMENYSEKLMNPFCKTILMNIGKEELVAAESRLALDTNLYYLTNNEDKNCMSLINHVYSLQNKLSLKNDFIMQETDEQRISLLYSKSKLCKKIPEYCPKECKVDKLSLAFSSKLKLTPEKTRNDENVFKTPMNKKISTAIPKSAAKSTRKKIDESQLPEIIRPTIKFDLDAVSGSKEVGTSKQDDVFDSLVKTPAPNPKCFKIPKVTIASPKRYGRSAKPKTSTLIPQKPQSSIKTLATPSAVKRADKHSLKRSTSPGNLSNDTPKIGDSKSKSNSEQIGKNYSLRKRNN